MDLSKLDKDCGVTEEVIESLRWLGNELRDEKRSYEAKICRVAADRLEKLDSKCTEFAGILPACEGCDGKTAIGERTKDCVYNIDDAYCMDRARKNYFAMKARVEEMEKQSEGVWIVTENGCVINCSECGYRLELCYPDGTEVRSLPCCPNCGAKMDGSSDRKKPVLIDGRCRCPRCKNNKSLLGLYCDNCGQAIDWETE